MEQIFKSVWEEWEIVELIGEGSYGKVYKAVKKEHDVEMFSAIKIITIPKSQGELKSLRAEGMSISESRTYLQDIVNGYVNEIKTMISLSSASNIVNVYDYKVIEKKEEVGWEIHIRMELLTSFEDYITEKLTAGYFTEQEIIKFGMDICSALELCAKQNPPIIHRDIKPDNIFISKSGEFKLGDFGTAREIEKSKGSYSEAGTPIYMAPEVKNRTKYGVTADICSLGIVLYRLTNNNRLPFCDPNKQMLNHNERKEALDRRFNGEPLLAPINANEQMAHIILKACSYDPEDRFQSASELKAALEAAGRGEYVPDNTDGTIKKRRAKPAENYETKKPENNVGTFGKKKKSKAPLILTAVLLVVIAVLGIGGYLAISKLTDPIDTLKKYVDEGNYVEAAAIINDKIADDDKKLDNATSFLSEKTKEIVNEYVNETKTYDEALSSLESIRGLKVVSNSEIDGCVESVNSLRVSRNAYQAAQTYITNQDYENAIKELRNVTDKDKNYSSAQQQLTSSITSYKDNTFAKVGDYETANNYDDALSFLDKAQDLLPNDVDISSRINVCKTKQNNFNIEEIKRQITESKQNAENTKNYTEEINILKLLQQKNPDNADLTKAITDLQNSHASYIVLQANEFTAKEDYNNAISTLRSGLSLYPNNTTLDNALTSIKSTHANNIVAQATTLSTAGKYTEALSMLNDGLDLYPNETSLQNAITATEKSHSESIITQADKLAKNKNYEGAIKLLSDNQYMYSSYAADFQIKIDEYTALLPESLYSKEWLTLHQGGSGTFKYTDNLKTSTGDVYSKAIYCEIRCYSWENDNLTINTTSVEYYLNRNYSSFSGDMVIPFDTRNSTDVFNIYIYCDDKQVYKSPDIGLGFISKSFKVDVKNTTKLKIEIVRSKYGSGYSAIGIVNALLEK